MTFSMLTIPQPDPLAQPTPTWLAWSLLMLTFVLHLVAMNMVLGGSLIAAVARTRGRAGHPYAGQLATWVAKLMPVFVASAVTLGVAALLFLQVLYGRLFFASSVVVAAYWLAVVPLLVAAYYGTYVLSYRGERSGTVATIVAWLVVVLFVAIATIYSNNMSLMLRPEAMAALYQANGRGVQLDFGDAALVPRFLHLLLGAIAVGGLVVALVGWVHRHSAPDASDWAIRYGTTWTAAATLLNLVPGFWWLLALPRPVLLGLMSSMPAVALFAGVTTGLVALGAAFMTARARQTSAPLWLAVGSMLVTVVAMALTRDQLRTASLETEGFRATSWVAPQWAAIFGFLALFVGALVAIGWMVALLAGSRSGGAGELIEDERRAG